MVRHCPNCAAALVFDINSQKLECKMCGSYFDVEEIGSEMEDETQYVDEHEFIEYQIYRCNQCGAEVSINDTEASTFCVYCGNPTIVFSRISKQKKPEYILPFKVTKDEAVSILRQRLQKGFFVPNEIKNFKIDTVRGIYIPHFITGIKMCNSAVIKSRIKSGKSSKTIYSKRNVYCEFDKVLTDSSRNLNDESSQRLEPYALSGLKDFDEDYLSGYYADMADVSEEDAQNVAKRRAEIMLREEILKSVSGSGKEVIRESLKSEYIDKSLKVMLPAWFLTFRYEGLPHTIMINGQTGKVVGGVPWDNKKVNITALVLIGILGVIASIIFAGFYSDLGASDSYEAYGKLTIYLAAGAIALFVAGVNRIKKVKDSIRRTTASSIVKFANNRQEGQ